MKWLSLFLRCSPRYRQAQPLLLQSRSFHASVLRLDRKGGSQAFEVGHRDLSKKQKRRRSRVLEARALKRDPKKEKLKAAYAKRQFESPEMQAFIESTKKNLAESLQGLLLPDGLMAGLDVKGQPRLFKERLKERLVDHTLDPTDVLLQLQRWNSSQGELPRAKLSGDLRAGAPMVDIVDADAALAPMPPSSSLALITTTTTATTTTTMSTTEGPSVTPVTPLEANRALAMLVEQGETEAAKEMLQLMASAQLAPQCVSFTHAMSMLSRDGYHEKAVGMFERMVVLGVEPDTYAWTALVQATACAGKLDEARSHVERLSQLGLATVPMYNVILHALVQSRRRDEVEAMWERMHLEPGLQLSLQSFTIMLRHCAHTRETERAFFYMDELRGLGHQPDVVAFTALLRACAGAPHWVNGYQDTIFEAMAQMEGAELIPTTETYNAIIYAFGKAGDCAAAEYYWWEMRSKGLSPTRVTYNALFDAYAKSQSVGARDYGTRGRYVRPAERPKTAEEKLFLEVGSAKVTKAMSQGLWQEGALERGKRQTGPLLDLMDEEEGEGDLVQLLEHEAGRGRGLVEEGEEEDHGDEEIRQQRTFASKREEAEAVQALMASLPAADKVTVQDLMTLLEGGELDGGDDALEERQERGQEQRQEVGEEEEEEGEEGGKEEKEEKQADAPPKRTGRRTRHAGKGARGMDQILSFLDAAQAKEESKLRGLRAQEAALLGHADDEADEAEWEREKKGPRPENWISTCAQMSFFADPFSHLREQPPTGPPAAPLPEPAREALHLLDAQDDGADGGRNMGRTELAPPSTPPSNPLQDDDDGGDASRALMSAAEKSAWSIVEFGRAPPPDYSPPLPVRQAHHIRRAEMLYEDFRQTGLEPDTTTLTSFMSVYAEALKDQRALKVMETFALHGVGPDVHSYRALVRMFIRKKDVATAQQVCDEMHAAGLVGDGELYGMLVQSYAHRDALPEALKALERATDARVRVPERHLKVLRARCVKLGVKHPDMPADPHAWVKAAKQSKARVDMGSSRRVQGVKTWN